jgi:hypothetical protein
MFEVACEVAETKREWEWAMGCLGGVTKLTPPANGYYILVQPGSAKKKPPGKKKIITDLSQN